MHRTLAFRLLRFSLMPFILRNTIQRRRVTVILYHEPEAEKFASHLRLLRKQYTIISLQRFIQALETGNVRNLPTKALVATLDDGHRTNFLLLPVLREFDVPVSIFVCTGIVGSPARFWFKHAPDPEALRHLDDESRIDALRAIGFETKLDDGEREALSDAELQTMSGKLVEFQSHTVTHPILPCCSDEKAEREIRESRTALERDYGFHVNALAYPNGDYAQREVELAKRAGYSCAFTVDWGYNSDATDPFRLKRIAIHDEDDLSALVVKASGLWGVIRGAARRVRKYAGANF